MAKPGTISQADILAIIQTVQEHGTPIADLDAETISEFMQMNAVLTQAFGHAADLLEQREAEPRPRMPIQQARREIY